jgi:uncharacterized protein (TIGR02284 family)
MNMDSNDIVKHLNGLIEINNDRVEGYQKATEEAKDETLKSLFKRFADGSRMYRNELVELVRNSGGEPAEGTTNSGKLYRVWMDIKAALAGHDRKAVLSNCEYGEDVALESYRSVTEDRDLTLPSNIREILQRQQSEIKRAHDEIKQMRDLSNVSL